MHGERSEEVDNNCNSGDLANLLFPQLFNTNFSAAASFQLGIKAEIHPLKFD